MATSRLAALHAHLEPPVLQLSTPVLQLGAGSPAGEDHRLRQLFGAVAWVEGPLWAAGGGRRYHGVDLRRGLRPEQVGGQGDLGGCF
jgi:hypothetical protein